VIPENRASVFSTENKLDLPVYAHDVFTVTDAGTEETRNSASRLPPEALALLVALDGKLSVGDVEQRMPQLAALKLRDLLRSLLAAALIREVTMAEAGDLNIDFDAFLKAAGGKDEPSVGVVASANKEATTGEARLKREGYYVSIARASLSPRKPAAGGRYEVFIVEDEADVRMLVETFVQRAGLDVASAARRDDVVARFRRPPPPDIVVLDVKLPDLDGFDLLHKLKAHPVLKPVPVVMLTADSSRESIVRGLTGGADGYVTKPFDPPALIKGIKAVLGIA
jgi:CheY-like chemotaxis protein